MKIERIKIENFRSLRAVEIECSDFNAIVGQNNVGKTNLFEALQWFFNGTPLRTPIDMLRFKREAENLILVEVEFSGATHGANSMRNEVNKTKMLGVLEGNDRIIVRRICSDAKRSVEVNGKVIEKLPTGFDRAFNDFLPKFEFVHTKQNFGELAKYSKKTPIGIMLSSVLEAILEGNQQYLDFKDKFAQLFDSEESEIRAEFDSLGKSVQVHLERQFSDCASVTFEVTSPLIDDLLKSFETLVDDGVETYAHEKGDGMQRALMLAIIQAYAEHRKARDDAGKSFLFCIDEAELHLHPTAQRNLKEVLLDICSDLDQVFINTHSSVLVADEHKAQKIHRVEKNEGETQFFPVTEHDKPYIVYELLGGSPADLLLPRNFVVVEGPSEVDFLKAIIERFYGDKPEVQIIAACGDTHQAERSINAIEKTYQPLGHSLFANRVIIVCDKPTVKAQGGFEDFSSSRKSLFDNGQVCLLPHGSLEECYPNTEGWQQTPEQVKAMDGKKKRKLAKKVGQEISKEAFESSMSTLHEALERAWRLAFQ